MNRLTTLAVVAVGAGAVMLGGSMYAFADWQTTVAPVTLRMKTIGVPTGPQAGVTLRGAEVLITVPAKETVAPGVTRHVVTRHDVDGRKAPVEVCQIDGTACTDDEVPHGMWTYTVHTVIAGWRGLEGRNSTKVKVAAAPSQQSPTPAGRTARDDTRDADNAPPPQRRPDATTPSAAPSATASSDAGDAAPSMPPTSPSTTGEPTPTAAPLSLAATITPSPTP